MINQNCVLKSVLIMSSIEKSIEASGKLFWKLKNLANRITVDTIVT